LLVPALTLACVPMVVFPSPPADCGIAGNVVHTAADAALFAAGGVRLATSGVRLRASRLTA